MRGISEERLKDIGDQMDSCRYIEGSLKDWLLDECEEINPWLPIDENTPKDRELWLYWKSTGHIECGFYNHMCGQGSYPTHYQELPDDPV